MWGRSDGVDRTWRAAEKEFVRACEAFLDGRYPEFLDDRGRPTPEWAWVNVLAHGTPERLRELAAGVRAHRYLTASTRTWEEALSFLAEEVLAAADAGPGGLAGIQRDVLYPLETRLTTTSPRAERVGPRHFVHSVTEALEHRPGARRPSSGRRGQTGGSEA